MYPSEWSIDELKILKENAATCNIEQLMILLPKRSEAGIRKKACTLQLRLLKSKQWTPELEKKLEDNWYIKSNDELEGMFNKSFNALSTKAIQLGLYGRKSDEASAGRGGKVSINNGDVKIIIQRPPAVYSNINHRQLLLDRYAPIN